MNKIALIEKDLGYFQCRYSVVLVIKDPPADAGEVRDVGWILGQEDPLE